MNLNFDGLTIIKDLNDCVNQVKKIVQESSGDNRWVVFDIDGTLISDRNYRHLYETSNDVFKFMYRGNFAPIQEMISLANWCRSQGVKLCLLTGRKVSFQEPTKKNLQKVGITDCERLYFKQGRIDNIDYKSQCRKEILDSGGRILANIGDTETDFLIPTLEGPKIGYSENSFLLPKSL